MLKNKEGKSMDISLIIPCYNEEGNVDKFFAQAESVFANKGLSYEYIFVNDGSTDLTKKRLADIYTMNYNKNITVVNFSRNFGKEAAIMAGLKNAVGNHICLIDADLQQHPSVALDMYNYLQQNDEYDCVCAYQETRSEGKGISALKSIYYTVINKIAETEFRNGASDFRMFKAKVKDAVLSLGEYHRFSKGLFSWVGFNVAYMPYTAEKRNDGKSKWNIFALTKYAVSGLLSFSTAPLHLSTVVGSCATIFAIIYAIVTIFRKLFSDISVDGFTQIVILITFFSGLLLFSVGIIGEYIAKIYQQVKNRPVYIEDEVLKRNNM